MHQLIKAIQDLSRARTVEQIAAIVRVTARELTGADGATFVLLDGDRCHYLDEDAIGPLWKGKRFPARSCISGWCMQNRSVAAIEDIYADERIPHDAYRPTFVQSLVMVPIRSSDPLGAIGNYWAERHVATEQEIELLRALADSTAIAMENAYLHASMQRQIEERTRESRIAREQAEDATKAKSRFLAAASHNLRQPVQTLSLVASILERACKEREPREHVAAMKRAIGNMQSMLDTLLDLHRLEAGAIEPQRRDTVPDEMLENLRSEFAYVANEKSLSLEIPATGPTLHTDPSLLQEILRNFISNAIKYTSRGEVCLEWRESGDDVLITIADTGPGIPAAHLSRIFDAFYRAPNDAAKRAGADGVGLGLSIADQLARTLCHRLTVESTPGIGSRFSITVPRARASLVEREAPLTRAAAWPSPTGARRVLYIEDDAGVRGSITMLLGLEGCEVASFSNGADALDAIASGAVSPELLISDYHLPAGETGPGIVERIRARLGRRVPALLLTGEIREWRTASSGPDPVLSKPVNADLLLATIDGLVGRRAAA